jgi:hypothetical protein
MLTEPMLELALHLQICTDLSIALELLRSQKFEAIIIDLLLGESAQAILKQVRASPSNRTAVIFSITATFEGSAEAFQPGSSFVLERPLSEPSVSRTLKAAYGLIVRERRRYFRCPIAVAAEVQAPGAISVSCRTLNISEGGMALTMPTPPKAGAKVNIQFKLPDRQVQFQAHSYVCWSDERSQMGLLFISASREGQSELQQWLSQKLEEGFPESVAEKFRKTLHS